VEMNAIDQAFLDQSRHYLSQQYLPRIAASVERLSTDDLWWRNNPASNSAGNLLLHLAGNVRQWIISGLGGAPDHRQRQREFDARDGGSAAELLEQLRNTVREADAVLAALRPETLLERRVIQGTDVTVMEAIYHVVEHFSMHTGQIIFLTKLRTGADLEFYRVVDGVAHQRW
jgi:uncharacterized damage-inducible protein DinB